MIRTINTNKQVHIISPSKVFPVTGQRGRVRYIGNHLVRMAFKTQHAGFYCDTPWGRGFVIMEENTISPLQLVPVPEPEEAVVISMDISSSPRVSSEDTSQK